MRKLLVTLVLIGAAGAARAQAQAQLQGGPLGFHSHDGFALQLEGGFGSMSSSATYLGSEWKLSGTAGFFGMMAGGAVSENLVLGAHLWGVNVGSPDLQIGNQDVATDSSIGLTAFGVNVTYYFMPYNVYLSATPSFGTLTTTNPGGSTGSTESGFALRLAVGKEWWVSDNWGIGVNAQYAHASNKDKGTNPPTWATNWFGVGFSATYN